MSSSFTFTNPPEDNKTSKQKNLHSSTTLGGLKDSPSLPARSSPLALGKGSSPSPRLLPAFPTRRTTSPQSKMVATREANGRRTISTTQNKQTRTWYELLTNVHGTSRCRDVNEREVSSANQNTAMEARRPGAVNLRILRARFSKSRLNRSKPKTHRFLLLRGTI